MYKNLHDDILTESPKCLNYARTLIRIFLQDELASRKRKTQIITILARTAEAESLGNDELMENYRQTWSIYSAIVVGNRQEISYEELGQLRVLQDKYLTRQLDGFLMKAVKSVANNKDKTLRNIIFNYTGDALFWIESLVTCKDLKASSNTRD